MVTASDIILRLGGSAKVASETGFPLTTIEGWKEANFIPEWRQAALLDLALRLPIHLSTADFPSKAARIPSKKRRHAA